MNFMISRAVEEYRLHAAFASPVICGLKRAAGSSNLNIRLVILH